MKRFDIYNWENKKCLYSAEHDSPKQAIECAVESNVDLNYADLSGWNLSGVNLDDLQLKNARLCHANLSNANLSETNLENCDFSGATLSNACFAYARIKFCLFKYCLFSATDLHQSHLYNASFAGTSWGSISFQSCAEMQNCLFIDTSGMHIHFSAPPIVIFGLGKTPVFLFDEHCVMEDNTIARPLPITVTAQSIYSQDKKFFY